MKIYRRSNIRMCRKVLAIHTSTTAERPSYQALPDNLRVLEGV